MRDGTKHTERNGAPRALARIVLRARVCVSGRAGSWAGRVVANELHRSYRDLNFSQHFCLPSPASSARARVRARARAFAHSLSSLSLGHGLLPPLLPQSARFACCTARRPSYGGGGGGLSVTVFLWCCIISSALCCYPNRDWDGNGTV